MTLSIVEFLEARIAEDEQVARASAGSHNFPGGTWTAPDLRYDEARIEDTANGMIIYDEGGHGVPDALHIVRWDPARVLAECKAKRTIIDFYREENSIQKILWAADEADLNDSDRKHRASASARTAAYEVSLTALAMVYIHHPDFDPAWS